jgi:hypothetical protein
MQSLNTFLKSTALLGFVLLSLVSQNLQAEQYTGKRGIGLESHKPEARVPFSGGFYRALIIGNNVYHDPSGQWPHLKTAVTDARSLAQVLKIQYGFSDISLLENATRRDVLKAMEALANRALPNDNILVYYAGHGFIDDEKQRGFWVPVDANGLDNTTFLRNSTIRDELNLIASRAKHTLLISDSCFSGTLLRSGSRGLSQVSNTEKYFKKVSNKKSVQIMAAGGIEYVDDNYQSSGHSPFTYFLLNELKNNDRELITLSELSQHVTRVVANNVEQVPQSGVLQGAGDELGEFIFIKLNVEVDGVPAEKVKVQVNVVPSKGAAVKPVVIQHNEPVEQKSNIVKPHLPMPTL